MTILAIAIAVLTGFLIIRLAWPNALRFCRHDVLRTSLGAGVGMVLSSVIVFVVDAALGGSRVLVIAADLIACGAAAAAYLLLRRNSACPFCVQKPVKANSMLTLGAGLAVLIAAGLFYVASATNPHGEWDAFAIWNNHARFLASGEHWTRLFSPQLVWSVQDYPLLVPGAIANAWITSGAGSVVAPVAIAAAFAFASAGILFGGLEILRGKPQALLAVVVLFGAPALIRMGAAQYADVPSAFFYLAAAILVCIPDAFPDDVHSWWLGGFAAGAAAWTKNEGLVFLAVILVARAFGIWKSGAAPLWRRLPWMLAGAAPILIVVVWFKKGFAPANYLFTEQKPLGARLGDFSRYATVAVEFGKQLFTLGGWIVPPVLVAIAYLWLVGRARTGGSGRTATLATLCLMTAVFAGVYVITTKDLQWQIETSLSRVLMQLWPLSVFTFFLYAREPVEERAPEVPVPRREPARTARKRTAK